MKLGIGGNTLAFICLTVRSVTHHCSSDVRAMTTNLVDAIAVGVVVADNLASREIPVLKAKSWRGKECERATTKKVIRED